jgi:hypothetical protein
MYSLQSWGFDVPNPSATFHVAVLPSLGEGIPTTILDTLAVCEHLLATAICKVQALVIPEQPCLFAQSGGTSALRKAILGCLRSHSFAQQDANLWQEHIQESLSANSTARYSLDLYERALDRQMIKETVSPLGV